MPATLPGPKRKRPANLSLAPARLAFGHRYAAAHRTSLSQVVNDLLGALENASALPAEAADPDPLDGMLAGWPELEQRDLRKAQHAQRLAR